MVPIARNITTFEDFIPSPGLTSCLPPDPHSALFVLFPASPAAPRIRAVHFARLLAVERTPAVHFPAFPAAGRALRSIPCTSAISCNDLWEVHVEKPAGRPLRRALPPYPCRPPCTSLNSLHEIAQVQGFGGSARHRVGIKGKCTAARPPPAQPAFGPPRAYSAPQPRKRRRHPERPPGSAPRGSRLRFAHSGNSPGRMHRGKLKLARPR